MPNPSFPYSCVGKSNTCYCGEAPIVPPLHNVFRLEIFSPCAWNASRYCPSLFFLRALICSVSLFILICCRATVSTDTARLTTNSARGPPGAAVYVAAAGMLSRELSNESSIWCDIFGASCCSGCSFPTGATPNSAKPPKGFCYTSCAASDCLFAT